MIYCIKIIFVSAALAVHLYHIQLINPYPLLVAVVILVVAFLLFPVVIFFLFRVVAFQSGCKGRGRVVKLP